MMTKFQGKHSDQGSMIPGFHQDFRSRIKISGHSDRPFAQNFDAVLAVIVICAGDLIFATFCPGPCKNTRESISGEFARYL